MLFTDSHYAHTHRQNRHPTILILLGIFQRASALSKNCRDGFCYEVVEASGKAWSYIKPACNTLGGYVFSFNSAEELDHVLGLLGDKFSKNTDAIYIGVTAGNKDLTLSGGVIKNDAKSAAWKWVDGSPVNVDLINDLYVDSPKVNSVANSVYCWTVYVAGSKKGRIQRRPCSQKTDAFVCKAAEVKSDYCYEVRWADSAELAKQNRWTGRKVLSPVTRYPLTHPKVQTGNCGKSIDGTIFPTDKWSVSGKVDASDASCKDEEGGDVFYGYLSNKYKGAGGSKARPTQDLL